MITLQLGNAAHVGPVDKLSIVLIAILSATFLNEQSGLANWLGVALEMPSCAVTCVAKD